MGERVKKAKGLLDRLSAKTTFDNFFLKIITCNVTDYSTITQKRRKILTLFNVLTYCVHNLV